MALELAERGPFALASIKAAFSARHGGVGGLARMAHDLLLRGYAGELSAEQQELLSSVRARAEHMNGIVKNVIMVASIEADTLRTEIEPQDLWFAIENAVAPLRSGFNSKGIALEIDLPEHIPQIMADREHLRMILTQLLDNALRYTTSGRVSVSAVMHGSDLQLDITDTGPGIPPEEIGKLFTRFHRIEGNNSQERGSGLGLAITRQLVERLGGRVWASSTPGHGSTFSLSLPVADGHADAVVGRENADTTA